MNGKGRAGASGSRKREGEGEGEGALDCLQNHWKGDKMIAVLQRQSS